MKTPSNLAPLNGSPSIRVLAAIDSALTSYIGREHRLQFIRIHNLLVHCSLGFLISRSVYLVDIGEEFPETPVLVLHTKKWNSAN